MRKYSKEFVTMESPEYGIEMQCGITNNCKSMLRPRFEQIN